MIYSLRMRCSYCNTSDHEPYAKYCHYCGSPLSVQLPKNNGYGSSKDLIKYGRAVQNSWERMRERQQYEDTQQVSSRSIVLRYCILFIILVEIVLISFLERQFGPWGLVTIIMVNCFVFISALALSILANQGFFRDKLSWRKYYEWLHFLVAALAPILGYLIASSIHNLWSLLFDSILIGFVVLADFGTLEDILDVL